MDDIDDFFASLDTFAVPSLNGSLDQFSSNTANTVNNNNNSITNNRRTRKRKRDEEDNNNSNKEDDMWACPQCTLLNKKNATVCEVCEFEKPKIETNNNNNDNRGLICSHCTFLNAPDAHQCLMCNSPLNNNHNGEGTATPSFSDSSSSSSEEDDDEDSEDDWSESDSNVSSTPNNNNNNDTDIMNQQELVKFLELLDSVPNSALPCSAPPSTMVAKGALRPFQLQGLSWMMQQEKGNNNNHKPERNPTEDDDLLFQTSSRYNENNTNHNNNHYTNDAVRSVQGGILADFMGLGKTRTVLSLCEATHTSRGHTDAGVTGSQVLSTATLIICPTSVLAQWEREIKACIVPTPRICIFHGSTTRSKKMTLFRLAQDYDYVLTSYHTLSRQVPPQEKTDASLYHRRPYNNMNNPNRNENNNHKSPGVLYMVYWRRIVLDEAHIIRNTRTRLHKGVLALAGRYRWAVTATPLQNSINDLFSIFKFLQVPYFGDVRWWNKEIVSYLNRDLYHPRPTTALRIVLGALLLRRTPDTKVNPNSEETILNLPPKEIKTEFITLSKEETTFYEAIHQSATQKLNHHNRQNPYQTALNSNRLLFSRAIEMLVRCRQVCLHPYIVVAALRRCHPSLQPPQEEQDSTAPPTTTAEEEQKRKEEAQTLLTKAVNHFIDTTLKKHTKLNQNNQSMFLQELIDELRTQKLTERECIICLEKITIPSILPCGHLFCENCITHAVEAQKRCPLCKRTTKKSEILVVPTSLLGDTNHTNNENNNNNDNNNTVVDPIQVFSSVPSEQCAVLSQWPLSLSAKTQFIIHQLQHVIPQDERVVIFSYFTSYLEYLATVLPAQQISCIQYTGKLTRRQKEKVLQSFRGESANNNNNNEVEVPPRVLLASFSASSVGLNLVCANHCILCEPSWNPGQVSQALHRVHRIGQQRPVTITKLIAKNTVEEKVEELCQRKSSLAEHCFNTPGNNNQNNNNGNNARMRTQDLIALFVDEKEEEDEESSEED